MNELIQKYTSAVTSVTDAITALVIAIAIVALIVIGGQAIVSGDDVRKHEKIKQLIWVIAFVVIVVAARALITWAQGL